MYSQTNTLQNGIRINIYSLTTTECYGVVAEYDANFPYSDSRSENRISVAIYMLPGLRSLKIILLPTGAKHFGNFPRKVLLSRGEQNNVCLFIPLVSALNISINQKKIPQPPFKTIIFEFAKRNFVFHWCICAFCCGKAFRYTAWGSNNLPQAIIFLINRRNINV